MRRARVRKEDGFPTCRKCGSLELLAKSNERGKRTLHLKCAQCGERQRYRQPKDAGT